MALSKHSGSGINPDGIWNLLSILLLLGTVLVVVISLVILLNPNISINPYPPVELPPTVVIIPTDTPTATQLYFPPTWTMTPTISKTSTESPPPTVEILPSLTFTPTLVTTDVLPPQGTPPTVTPTVPPGFYAFEIVGNPEAIASTIMKPNDGCKGMWLAGQVFDITGAPLKQMIVQLHGAVNNQPIDGTGFMISVSGFAPQYGPSGYEFFLADKPVATHGALYVQLTDQASLALSARAYFDTTDDCSKNLILINFKQVR